MLGSNNRESGIIKQMENQRLTINHYVLLYYSHYLLFPLKLLSIVFIIFLVLFFNS
jgi:hypothetical protein